MPPLQEHCVCGFLPRDTSMFPPFHPPLAARTLLTHNEPPVDSETPEIVDFLASAKERRELLDRKIVAVAAVIDSLVAQRDLLSRDIRSCAAAISPLRQLPTEILCRIFPMTLKPLAYMQLPQPPWYLGQISRRWREIAIGMPLLWSSFGVPKLQNPVQSPLALDRFREQFHRAGNAPLDVTLRCAFSRLDGPLLDACGRWQTLSTVDIHTDFEGLRARVPMLRRIHALRGQRIIHYEFSAPFPGICDLASSTSSSPLTSLPTRWEHLTRYDGPVEWATHLDILRQATHLVECRMVCRKFTDTPLQDDIVQLPNLRRFSVSKTHTLKYIAAPGLLELVIDADRGLYCEPDAGDPAHIVEFLRRTRCTLARLSLLSLIPTLELLLAVPSLHELTVKGTDKDPMVSVIQNLFPAEGGECPIPVLPNLTALSLGTGIVGNMPIDLSIELIAARFEPRACYKQLQFFGILFDVARPPGQSKFNHTPPMRRLAKMQWAGLELGIVKGTHCYAKVRASDIYSMRRCAHYNDANLTSSDIW
ncbi:hypothetical protein DFH06DRAFT_377997 [Mycena polygramma]|nr:hypothetical protein DFH06DRAFT_377997 [Mycena polygramma]